MEPVVLVAPSVEVLARWPVPSLTPAEQARAGKLLRGADDFVAAHLLAREAVGALLDQPAAEVVIEQTCETCGGPHGLPRVKGGWVSWSHTAGYVAAAAALDRVGIDLEADSGVLDPAMVARVTSPAERVTSQREFLELWTKKEVLVKLGLTTLDNFARVTAADFTLQTLDFPGIVGSWGLRPG